MNKTLLFVINKRNHEGGIFTTIKAQDEYLKGRKREDFEMGEFNISYVSKTPELAYKYNSDNRKLVEMPSVAAYAKNNNRLLLQEETFINLINDYFFRRNKIEPESLYLSLDTTQVSNLLSQGKYITDNLFEKFFGRTVLLVVS